MRIRLKSLSGGFALVLALTACGPADPAPEPSTSSPPGTGSLTIWSGWGDYEVLQGLCQGWAQARSASCSVFPKTLADLKGDFERLAPSGEGPDVLAYAHDALGEFVEDGLVRPVDLDAITKSRFVDLAIDALQVDGVLYGVPTAVENVALLTNRALAPRCPETVEQLTEQAGRLIESGISVQGVALGMQVGEQGDAYHWHPLYTAGGGYLFGRDQQGDTDRQDLGVGMPGSVRAGVKLQELVDADVVNARQSRAVLERAFSLGKLAWWITGPWSLPAARDAGLDLAVCPVPTWSDGAPSRPLVGVQALFMSSDAPNPVLAQDFLTTYAPSGEFQNAMTVSGRPPALKASLDEAVAGDPILAGFAAYAQQGVPMPSVPEMDTIWTELGAAEVDILEGGDPEAALESAGQHIATALDVSR